MTQTEAGPQERSVGGVGQLHGLQLWSRQGKKKERWSDEPSETVKHLQAMLSQMMTPPSVQQPNTCDVEHVSQVPYCCCLVSLKGTPSPFCQRAHKQPHKPSPSRKPRPKPVDITSRAGGVAVKCSQNQLCPSGFVFRPHRCGRLCGDWGNVLLQSGTSADGVTA